MRKTAFLLGLSLCAPATAQQVVPATDEYVPPPPSTRDAHGIPYCDTLPDPRPPSPDGRPTVCAARPAQVVHGQTTTGSPWQVQIFSTFAYTAQAVEEDKHLTRAQGRAFLAAKPPWERSHRCGGSLIDVDMVLTAAHCVTPQPNGDVRRTRRVRVGVNDLASDQGSVARIAQVVVHAGYDPHTHANDIALVRLDWGRATPLVPTIPLAGPGQPDAAPGRRVAATGWGMTGARAPDDDPALTRQGLVNHASAELQEVTLAVQPRAACDADDDLRRANGPGVICALAEAREADTCQGDSGGPLTMTYLTLRGWKTILVGITSQGVGCAYRGLPSLYTRVSFYRDWIERARALTRRGYTTLP